MMVIDTESGNDEQNQVISAFALLLNKINYKERRVLQH